MSKRNDWLDVCRTIAIGLVILSHGRNFLLPLQPGLNWMKFGGFLGVELFFVLSGLLIGGIMLRELNRARGALSWIPGFWARRWLRTLPNYVVFVAINAALFWLLKDQAPPSIWPYLTFTQNLTHAPASFFIESWSLAVEELFYLSTPVLVAGLWGMGLSRRAAIYVGAMSILVFAAFMRWYATIHLDTSFSDIRAGVIYRLDAIMVGVILAVLIDKGRAALRSIQRLSYWLAGLFVLAAIWAGVPDAWLDHDPIARLAMFPMTSIGCAAVLIAGYHWGLPSVLQFQVSNIARLSYSAYLTNLPVLTLLRFAYPRPTAAGCVLLWCAYVAGTFLTAWCFYRTVERPVLAWRDRRIGVDAPALPPG